MSKTAIILSGQMRTFDLCLPSLHWHVFRKIEDPVFIVSCADDKDAFKAEMLRSKYPQAKVFIEKVTPPQLPEPDASYADFAPFALTPTKTPGVSAMQGILRQLWHLSRAWKFAQECGALEGVETVIRCRPDLHFQKFEMPGFVGTFSAYVPYWGSYGGVNDRFAVLGRDAAKAYFETYDNLPALLKLGCPFHPESLVAASLASYSIYPMTAEFAFRRPNDSNGNPVFEHMQVMPGELARYTASLSIS